MFKQLACSDILLKNKNHWSSSEELSAIYTQGIYKWQAINRRSFGSYNLCWNSIETSKKPIWTVPSFYYFFLSLPGIHCTLVSNTGRFFLGSIYLCVFCGLRVFLLCEYCSSFCWMTWQPYWRVRMGSKPSIPVVKLPRDTVVIVTGASSGENPFPLHFDPHPLFHMFRNILAT